nr:prealbumin-like fold domain-containing protein [uncultured Sphingobacterium sp.]
MKGYFFIVLTLLITMVSCKEEVIVNLVDGEVAGELRYKLTDDTGKGLSGIKVYLFDPGSKQDPNLLTDSATTNSDGEVYFTNLLPNNYQLKTDFVQLNNNDYRVDEYVQITAGIERKKATKLTDFSGILRIRLLSYQTNAPIKDQGVVAFPVNKIHVTSDNVADVVKRSTLKGMTDKNGYINLKVPANTDFDFIVHHAIYGNYGWGFDTYQVEKDKTVNITLYSGFL